MFRFTSFAAVPQINVLYIGATQILNTRYPIFLAINLKGGAVVAEFDAGEPGPASLFYSPSYALAADPLGALWVPDVAAGVRVFASQAAASVKGKQAHTLRRRASQLPSVSDTLTREELLSATVTSGDPQFVGLRGQVRFHSSPLHRIAARLTSLPHSAERC